MARKQLIQIRRDTAANWTSVNPVLANGEQGFETDTRLIKIGDGVTNWVNLLYTNARNIQKVFNVVDYGAIADVIKVTDGAITTGTANFTSATANFTASDVGKFIAISKAGNAGNETLRTTIKTVTSATQVVLNINALSTISNANASWGTDNTGYIQSALNAAQAVRGVCYIPSGSYMISTTIVKDTDNVTIQGDGKGKSVLVSGVGFGSVIVRIGSDGGPTARSNATVNGISFDMNFNYKTAGMEISWVKNVLVDDISVYNPASSQMFSMLILGVFQGENGTYPAQNITLSNSVFDYNNVTTNWEGVTLGYSRNYRIVNCQFLNKPGSAPALLNYNAENVVVDNCYFSGGFGYSFGGRGTNSLINSTFENSTALVQSGDNCIIEGNTFKGTTTTSANLSIKGYYFTANGGETPYYIKNTGQDFAWSCKNIIINANKFTNANAYAVNAGLYNDGTHTPFLDADSITFTNNIVNGSYWDGVRLVANNLIVTGNRITNSNQTKTNSTGSNYILIAKQGIFSSNASYDDQSTSTVVRDVLFDNGYSSTVVNQNWYLGENNLQVNSGTLYYFNSGFTTTKPNNITISQAIYDTAVVTVIDGGTP